MNLTGRRTGIGIGEDFKEHIFEPFTQEHQSARTNYDGVGLGMSIVKQMKMKKMLVQAQITVRL